MDSVFRITHELAEALRQTEEYQSMKQLEDRALVNSEAVLLFQRHTELETKLRTMIQSKDSDSDEVQAIRLEMLQVEHNLRSLDDISAMMNARERFNQLINQVNEVLQFELTGAMPDQNQTDSCTGSCATCPGCRS
ncbi:MAG: YlbF family regulator [Clostridia bacterium]|nr:YlbF family regulator [Clostridia bacterium]